MIAHDKATSRKPGDQIMTESTCKATTIEWLGARRSDHATKAPGGVRVDAIGVSRRIGGRQILHNLSLSVEPGELVAIAGFH